MCFSEEEVDWGVASDDQDQDEDECTSAEEDVDVHCECTKKTEHSQIKAISGIVNSANAEAICDPKSKRPTLVLKSREMVDLEKRFSAMVDRVSSEVRFWKIWEFWISQHKLTHAKNTKRPLEIHRSTLRARKRRKSKRDQRSCW